MRDGVDTEIEGVETPSTTAAQQSAADSEKQNDCTRMASPPSTSERISLPLIPLAPSQKRSKSRSQDAGKALGPSASGVHKVRAQQLGQKSPGESAEKRGSSMEREIQQRRSAPEQRLALEKELRGCKSAPDLGSTALAAIRSIQAGTLQLDRRMQSKIAAAAKRVLEARELKRKASRDNLASAGEAAATQLPQSPAAHAQPQRASSPPSAETSPREGWPLLPQSLSTAAAIARGEPLALPRQAHSPSQAPVEGGMTATASSSPKFYRPVPGLSMQAGTTATAGHRPFTVTTGVPRFAQESGASDGLAGALFGSTPPPSRTSSLLLSTGSAQLPTHTESLS